MVYVLISKKFNLKNPKETQNKKNISFKKNMQNERTYLNIIKAIQQAYCTLDKRNKKSISNKWGIRHVSTVVTLF